MARGGTYRVNPRGYAYVLNCDDTLRECQRQGKNRADVACSFSGIRYTVDSRKGLTRIHTRVSTPRDWKSYYSEQKHRALATFAAQKKRG